MTREATISVELQPYRLLEILLDALKPETQKSATTHSKVTLELEGGRLVLRVEAKSSSALRATLNSYLRWMILVRNVYETISSLETLHTSKNLY